ncbi:class I adenylate-forming enzyme family protein [Gordonia sp. NB41Y]|uniref:class I adenylate-forming enzyme family protein n=1 Tax=Gordonia sp. NB41Y TaxID=875808 RepID=UPI0006B1DA5A|nr:class I adenylate-forming enzyme family protein [Gordonia sp. NB41Y]EMP14897.2 fatty acid--CoA ligase [Gordonia sp. NB41Y]WLP89437.1 class I adenylate-forming enzyme family protein [Gordonia sp. NB41Y]
MTASTDAAVAFGQAMARLTGPDGAFELVTEPVLGPAIPVMKNRLRAVADLLPRSLRWGAADYIVTADRRISYLEHARAVAALATALRDRYGVAPGDRVGILAANTPEWVTAFWATQALGAVTVGLNAWWTPRETAYAVDHSRPTILVVDAKRASALPELPDSVTVLTMEEDLPALIVEFTGSPMPTVEVDEDDPSVILYTSGTSGRPKGALHSQRNLLAVVDYQRLNDAVIDEFCGRTYDPDTPSRSRHLLTSPLFHIASLHNLVVPRLATGGAVIMNQGAFDAETVLALIERERVTNWGAVPTMAARLLEVADTDRFDLSSLTAFALASAPSSIALKGRLQETFAFARNALVDSYGLTECSTAVSVATPLDIAAFPGTLGRPIITVDVEIRDPLGVPVADGVEGEVCVRSPFVMLGYWEDESATRAAIDSERWLRTGDHGLMEDGRLRLSGRRSDLILRGGENIYPTEIEQCLDEHPDVAECAALGVAHPDLGQEVAAVVVLHPGAEVTPEQLGEFAAERLAYFKVPTQWRITDEVLPRNATGKIMRHRIQA